MPFDHRLHPLSVLFGLGAQLRQLALPAIALLITARPSGMGWEAWLAIPIALSTLVALVRYLTFRYRYEDDHIVITDGLLFRNERHIPYARIQNIDAIQNVAHRIAGVAEVQIQTGAGQKPEATLDVLPLDALNEMRQRVFGAAAPAARPDDAAPSPLTPILSLDFRELVIFGLIHNRGFIVVGAIVAVVWEVGVMDRLADSVLGPEVSSRGLLRSIARTAVGAGALSLQQAALGAAAVIAFLVVLRVFSIGWAFVRLYRFTLLRSGTDLRLTFGLLTRVSATIPIHRIQTVSIREGPIHRLFDRVTVRVDTAGGSGEGATAPQREWLAPVVRRADAAALLAHILPGVALSEFEWHPPAPRAFRRELVRWAMVGVLASLISIGALGIWAPVLFPIILLWGCHASRRYVAHLRWGTHGGAIALKNGWIVKQTSVARFVKIQVVALSETPFDRRHTMASVHVDTAGGSAGSSRIAIPYMARAAAATLQARLTSEAHGTSFEW